MLSPYTGHLLKSVKRMAGAETKENGHISHSTISLNSKKKRKEKVHTQIKEPTILLQVRKAFHTKSNKAIAQQCQEEKRTC